jgi:hypothetical protein
METIIVMRAIGGLKPTSDIRASRKMETNAVLRARYLYETQYIFASQPRDETQKKIATERRPTMITDKEQVAYLNLLCRTYDGLTRVITSTKNRLHSLNPEMDADNNWIIKGMVENKDGTSIRYQGMENIKGQVSRRIAKELEFWPLWTEWMKGVPGIGPFIGGNLILKYYYAFIPACKDCGAELEKKDGTFWCGECNKSVKGEGNLEHKLKIRDFPMISSWWHYMGRHVVDGKVPKLKSGQVSDWSTPGRQVGYQIGQAFIKMKSDHLYRKFYDERRKLRDKTHPESTDMHKMNMALNETTKMFLSHMWQVARTIDGLPLTDPYIVSKDPIHKIIPPFYWDGKLAKAA